MAGVATHGLHHLESVTCAVRRCSCEWAMTQQSGAAEWGCTRRHFPPGIGHMQRVSGPAVRQRWDTASTWGLARLCTACMPSQLTTHDMWDCCPLPSVEEAQCIEALVPSTGPTTVAIKAASMPQRNSTWCALQCALPDRSLRGPLGISRLRTIQTHSCQGMDGRQHY